MKIVSAEFVKSAPDESGWPDEGLPEAAFAGRSNVGKSTLINRLVNRKSLARTSSKPGRTRMINFFRVNGTYMFADLPGYGWAKVSRSERASWKKMVDSYFLKRKSLRVVVLIVDIRRGLRDEEHEFIEWLNERGIPLVLVATKADKLKRGARAKARDDIARDIGVQRDGVLVFSGVTNEGRDPLWSALLELLS